MQGYEEVTNDFLETPLAEALEIIDEALVHGFEFIVENHSLYVKM